MPTSLESLRKHRAAHEGAPEHRRVWLFHAHGIFDHASPERVEEARAFRDRMARAFEGIAHVEMHSFMPQPIGPWTRGQFEVLFTRDAFTEVVTWLAFERPTALNVLVHSLSKLQVPDHSTRAIWLGEPGGIDIAFLAEVDQKITAAGRDEEMVIERTKKH
jgi:DOPA 4,5-dioxygenase